jgi:peroxiredoxin
MTAFFVGTSAPDFTLPSTSDQRFSLSEFRGRNVILAFYPADWSPVCGAQFGSLTTSRGRSSRISALC